MEWISNYTVLMPKRSLIARDGLSFLVLCAASITLFILTLLLFHSVEHHRQVLGRQLVTRGEAALRADQPAQAVIALRGALTFEDDFPTQVLLAQALTADHRTEEATNYLLGLREARPGDGYLSLQLARLYREQKDMPQAVTNYRSSIVGDWQGDGALRRREVRLELANYLMQNGQVTAGREELLTAAGNAPDTLESALLFAAQFQALGDPQDAFRLYTNALKLDPHDYSALSGAGEAAYTLGNYDAAHRLLDSALDRPLPGPESHTSSGRGKPQSGNDFGVGGAERQRVETLAKTSGRLLELDLSRNLPATERAQHLLLASRIAQDRLKACFVPPPTPQRQSSPAVPASPPAAASPLLPLTTQWQTAAPQLKQRTLERDAALEDQIAELINGTERATAPLCGAPQGDDALLLLLANNGNNH